MMGPWYGVSTSNNIRFQLNICYFLVNPLNKKSCKINGPVFYYTGAGLFVDVLYWTVIGRCIGLW